MSSIGVSTTILISKRLGCQLFLMVWCWMRSRVIRGRGGVVWGRGGVVRSWGRVVRGRKLGRCTQGRANEKRDSKDLSNNKYNLM